MDQGHVGVRARGRHLERPTDVLVDRMAYDSHYLGLLQVCELTGATIEVVPSTGDGTLDLDALTGALEVGAGRRWSPLTHVGTHRGLVNPVEEAGALCRPGRGALLPRRLPERRASCRSTSTRSAATWPPPPGASGCAARGAPGSSTCTGFRRAAPSPGHRRGAPRGGSTPTTTDCEPGRPASSSSRSRSPRTSASGWRSSTPWRSGSRPSPGRVGAQGEALRRGLAAIDGVEVHDGGVRRSGIVTFTAAGIAPELVAQRASAAGINVSVSTSPWALLDMTAPRPTSVVRASPHYYNTDAELDRLVDVVASVSASSH